MTSAGRYVPTQQPPPFEVGDALEQRDALGVGPVQVLEDDHGGTIGGQLEQDSQTDPEPLHLRAGRIGEDVELRRIDAVATVHCGQ